MSLDASFMVDAPIPRATGEFISPKVDRVIELIQQYDHHLEVRYIPRNRRTDHDPAFAIVYTGGGCADFVVMYVANEDEMDDRVLARIYAADNGQQNVLNAVDAQNLAVKNLQRAKYEDALAESADLAAHIWKSPKSRYKHNGVVYE